MKRSIKESIRSNIRHPMLLGDEAGGELLGPNLVPNGDLEIDDLSAFNAVVCTLTYNSGTLHGISDSASSGRIEIVTPAQVIGDEFKLTVEYSVPTYVNQAVQFHEGYVGNEITAMDSTTPATIIQYLTADTNGTALLRIYMANMNNEVNITRIALQEVLTPSTLNGWVNINEWVGA